MSERDEPFADEDAEENAPDTPNAADPKHGRRIRDAARRERAEAIEFWAGIFADERGRREMWRILESAGAFSLRFKFSDGTPDPLQAYTMAGEQRFGFHLFTEWMSAAPEGVLTMLKEHHPDLRPPPKPVRRRRNDGFGF